MSSLFFKFSLFGVSPLKHAIFIIDKY